MWIVLSSYSEDCMAAVLRDNPHSASELATSIHRYMELHPEGGRRTSQGRGNLYNDTRVSLTITEPRPLILKSGTHCYRMCEWDKNYLYVRFCS